MALVNTRRESQTIFYSMADGPAASVLDPVVEIRPVEMQVFAKDQEDEPHEK